MINTGRINRLTILRETSVGLFLGDAAGNDVLLPNKYCPETYEIGDQLEVFVYRDSEDRQVATNLTPKIRLHAFALLEVTAVTDVGAFLDWGMEKDLMVPFREQARKMVEGRWYIVYLDLDAQTDRLYATNKIEKHLSNQKLTVDEGDEVQLLAWRKTDLGWAVIVNNRHNGMLFANDIHKPLNVGDRMTGYVRQVRPDNKLDIALQPQGYHNFNDKNSARIHAALIKHDGFLPFHDKSPPDAISAQFGMSKKAFKKAIGALYKQRRIVIGEDGIRLV
ncbi:MAG: S1-like domain-containing RNA-binding protein [Saprospiraceae bacterium]|nr:S1-like domain-containing RNA-binding protein [Saprospiraceae bacterium]